MFRIFTLTDKRMENELFNNIPSLNHMRDCIECLQSRSSQNVFSLRIKKKKYTINYSSFHFKQYYYNIDLNIPTTLLNT
jgi:hypothetical protein